MRQISLLLFLAGVGTQAGHSFVAMMGKTSGLILAQVLVATLL